MRAPGIPDFRYAKKLEKNKESYREGIRSVFYRIRFRCLYDC